LYEDTSDTLAPGYRLVIYGRTGDANTCALAQQSATLKMICIYTFFHNIQKQLWIYLY